VVRRVGSRGKGRAIALGVRQELKQSQGLTLSPQMRQAIAILQMNRQELDALIQTEIETNPLLSRDADSEPEAVDHPVAESPEDWSMSDAPAQALEAVDVQFEDVHDAAPGDRASGEGETTPASGTGEFGPGVEGVSDAHRRETLSLADHLQDQLGALGLGATERAVALALIDALDGAGYLAVAPEEIAGQLGCAAELVRRVLARLQGLEPTGVFARDLRECLELQLKDGGRLDAPMRTILDRLDLVAARNLRALADASGLDEAQVRDRIAEIRTLTPRPGAAFGGTPTQIVTPDVEVLPDGAGGWRVELAGEGRGRLRLNQGLFAQVSQGARSAADQAFVEDCRNRADWLIRGLDHRAATILKVAAVIVQRQWAFFAYGVERLRPLTLKQVADEIGVHESTVSRAVAGKYALTERGIFELKFFFSAALAGEGGAAEASAEAVRHRVRRLVASEAELARDEGGVLSDERIVALLAAEGVKIARRTVAKYREQLGIPSSAERKAARRA
jgi:RNA polymerase sigma-54 factor